nr:GNAT family N-acetyltransferase [Amycolatopsis rhizosphaerae]
MFEACERDGFCLTGERLLLRNFVASDELSVHAFASNREVTRYTDWGPNSAEDTRVFLRGVLAQARSAERSEFNLAVVEWWGPPRCG